MSAKNRRPRPYQYVQRVPDRPGVWHHYMRRPGSKCVALPGLYGIEEFVQAYSLASMGGAHRV